MNNKKNYDNIMLLAKELNDLYEIMYNEIKPEVNYIIQKQITSKKTIEDCLDKLLDIPTTKAESLFNKLCNYYEKINKEIATEYREIYKELYFDDFKKIKKRT